MLIQQLHCSASEPMHTAKHCTHKEGVTCPNTPDTFLSFAFTKCYSAPLWPFCRCPAEKSTLLSTKKTFTHNQTSLLITQFSQTIFPPPHTIRFRQHYKMNKCCVFLVAIQQEIIIMGSINDDNIWYLNTLLLNCSTCRPARQSGNLCTVFISNYCHFVIVC